MDEGGPSAPPSAEPDPPSAPRRPPVLASEALRRDLMPRTPGRGLLRVFLLVLGTAGAGAVGPLAAAAPSALPVAGALAILALLGASPMPYAARAASVVAIGAAALTVTAAERIAAGGGPVALVLDIGIVVLGAGLAFRAWHRASLVARLLVLVGVLVCGGWLWLTHAFTELTILDTKWQGWLPRVVPVLLTIVLMLSLLAFMDARSTGGSGAWAGALLVWYAIHQWARLAAESWLVGAMAPALAHLPPAVVAAGIAGPLFVALVAVGLAQLLAVAASDE